MAHSRTRIPAALCAAVLALTLIACNAAPSPTPIADNRNPGYDTPPRSLPDNRTSDTPRSGPHRGHSRHNHAALEAQPGDFDFYLLNLSWSPEFCETHAGKPECAQHLGFVLPGLWPQTNNGGHPENCSNLPGPSNPSAYQDIYPDPGLLQHEWQVHGTCSGLSPSAFFDLARKAVHILAIPSQLTALDHQISMPPAAILGLFNAANPGIPPSSLALSCGNNALTAVELCLSTDLHPIACQQIRSCRANTVRIPPPGVTGR